MAEGHHNRRNCIKGSPVRKVETADLGAMSTFPQSITLVMRHQPGLDKSKSYEILSSVDRISII